ncbi:MAG: HlyC/CorC family transporter [Bryobacterales bacterium]|nr:HlyC/CorC family transporter [Bryobacterales bacterium]
MVLGIATVLFVLLLALVSFVQLLYLESLRLRTRDLPALEFFKESLEDRLGMKTDRGAQSFSLLKHTLLVLGGLLAASAITSPARFVEAAAGGFFLMLLSSYLAPHLLYRRTSGAWLTGFVQPLRALALMVRPLVVLMEFFDSLIELGEPRNGKEEAPPSAAENIEALIDAGAEEGLIQEDDRELIQSVVEFGDKTVREVMTPRPDIVAIEAGEPLETLRELVIKEQFSRIPVYEESIDQMIGFVHVRDMFELEYGHREAMKVKDLMRPIRMVPETKPVSELLREMQQESTHMVIVVDEYGNTAGLATMEDLVEVILGEIRDEHEPGSDVQEDGEGGYIVAGSFDVARLHDLFDFRPDGETESTTIGGLVTEWLGRVPQAGETVERDGLRVEVLASNELRVEQVRLSKSHSYFHA